MVAKKGERDIPRMATLGSVLGEAVWLATANSLTACRQCDVTTIVLIAILRSVS